MKILLIEKDEDLAYLIKRIIQKKGHEITTFEEYDSCILSDENSRPDLILVDEYRMNMDGCEICGTLKNIDPMSNIRVIPIIEDSITSWTVDKEKCPHVCNGFVIKPFSNKTLLDSVEKASLSFQLRTWD